MRKYKPEQHNPVLAVIALILTLSFSLWLVNQRTSIKTSAANAKVSCTNLSTSVTSGIAPLTTNFSLSGFAAKGSSISQYRFVFGDGAVDILSSTPSASHSYINPGTYIAKGYLVDKQGNVYGGTGDCQKTISVRDGTIVVDKTYVAVTLDAKNSITSLLYGSGFSITSEGATGFQIKYNEPTQGQGFETSSGGIVTGRTVNIRTYINPIKGDGVYSGSAIVQYSKNGVWSNGPTVSYVITLINSPYITSGTIKLDKTDVNVTLRRDPNTVSSLVYGPGFTITSEGASGFQIKYNEPTQGQGFDLSSGGMTPNMVVTVRTYINTNKPNGIYSGSAVVQYSKNGVWSDGPTVTYTINLTD